MTRSSRRYSKKNRLARADDRHAGRGPPQLAVAPAGLSCLLSLPLQDQSAAPAAGLRRRGQRVTASRASSSPAASEVTRLTQNRRRLFRQSERSCSLFLRRRPYMMTYNYLGQRMGAPKTESSVDSRPYEGVHHIQKYVQKTVPQGPGCLDTCKRYRRDDSRTSHCARSGSSGRCCEPVFLSHVQSQCRRYSGQTPV